MASRAQLARREPLRAAVVSCVVQRRTVPGNRGGLWGARQPRELSNRENCAVPDNPRRLREGGRALLSAAMLAAIRSVAGRGALFALILLAATGALSSVLGCDRNLETLDPNEEPRQPDLARIFPADQEDAFGSALSSGRGENPTDRRGEVPVDPVGSVTPPSGAMQIRGRVEIAPELLKDAGSGSVLFLIARSGTAAGGPPLAVRRFTSPRFPLEFEIGPENVMIPSMRFEGAIQLTARLDSDGNAMTRLPGDLQGAMSTPLSPGAEGALLMLDQKL